jgi:rare lipoprotein A (peptidoglycan hydrolase)
MQAYLARTGVAVFAILMAITLITEQQAAGRALVAGSSTVELPALREIAPIALEHTTTIVVAGPETAPTIATDAPPAPVAVAAPISSDAIVLASWYGPGFYGNHTACGQVYTPEIFGVAHLTLPCGTKLTLTYGSRSVTVAVIDRGPYIAGRTLDLSNATKLALACTDLCTLRMQLAR